MVHVRRIAEITYEIRPEKNLVSVLIDAPGICERGLPAQGRVVRVGAPARPRASNPQGKGSRCGPGYGRRGDGVESAAVGGSRCGCGWCAPDVSAAADRRGS